MRQFYFLLSDNSSARFHCHYYSRHRYPEGHKVLYHSHAYSEIIYITDGTGFFHLIDKAVPIQRGSVIFNNSNIQHALSARPNSALECVMLSVNNLMFSNPSADKGEYTFFMNLSKEHDTVFDYIAKIEWEAVKKMPLWQTSLNAHIDSFIVYLLRSSNLLVLPKETQTKPNPISNIYLFLTSNFDEDITLDKLANIFCMNKYYMAHSFKNTYGKSIIDTLNQIRCQQARHLLQTTDHSINDVATSVGYNSSSYFSKIYQQFYNETPSQTKKRGLNISDGKK